MRPAMEQWSNEFTLWFLEEYHREPVLWDPKHASRRDHRKVSEAWTRISEKVNRPVGELKKKRDSLRTNFKKLLLKKRASAGGGAGAGEGGSGGGYRPLWFAYDYMETFLAPVYDTAGDTLPPVTAARVDRGRPPPSDRSVPPSTSVSLSDNPATPSSHTPLTPTTPSLDTTATPAPDPPAVSVPGRSDDLQDAWELMREAFGVLSGVVTKRLPAEREDDECGLYGRLLAKRLRRLPEEARGPVMHDIDAVLLQERLGRRGTSDSISTAPLSPAGQSRPPSADPAAVPQDRGQDVKQLDEPLDVKHRITDGGPGPF